MKQDIFSFLPIEVITDHRLGLIETRVLSALFSFRGKNTNVVWPSREALSNRCGYQKNAISKAVTKLVGKGWLERKQHRGPNTYTIIVPEVAELETVADSDTVSDPDTNSGRLGQQTVAEPATPELTITNHRTNHSVCFDRFWTAYPKKQEKKKCAAIWKQRNLDTLGDMIVADVTRRRIDDAQWQNGYIPNPQTYLNGDRWEDEIQTRNETSEVHRNSGFSESRSARAMRIFRERHGDNKSSVSEYVGGVQRSVPGVAGGREGPEVLGVVLAGDYSREKP